jgi:hypothetical protein
MPYNYARRVELARQRGFVDPTGKANPYTYYRKVTEFANKSEQFVTSVGEDITYGGTTAGVDEYGEGHNLDTARLFYEAFVLGDEDDYSVHMSNREVVVKYVDGKPVGAKAKVIIDILHYVPSAAAWRRLYPTKTRFGHLVQSAEVKRTRAKKVSSAKRSRRK